MPIYTVDTSMRSTAHDYSELLSILRAAHAQPLMDTTHLIDLRDDLQHVTRALLSLMAPGDGLFVTELAPETRWTGTGMSDAAKTWIRARSTPSPPQPPLGEQPVRPSAERRPRRAEKRQSARKGTDARALKSNS